MGENCIKFNICGQKQNTIRYSMNKTSKMLKMKLYYSERVEIPVKNLQFTFKQICIGEEKTPEVLGMKNGDTVNVSFTDEDCYLMEFGPRHIKDPGRGKISYQAILQLAEFTGKLFDVWKKRVVGARESGTEVKNFVPFHGLEMNFYQMSPKKREKLIKYSVDKLLDIFESEEEIERFKDCIFKVEKFTKMCIFNILENCLPISLPYPVLRIVTGHLLAVNGLDQMGQVTEQNMERKCMEKLYYCLADIYKHLKVLMFNTDRQWHNGSPLYTLAVQKREDLLSRLQVLSDLLDKLVDGSNENVHTEFHNSVEDELVEGISEDCMLVEIEINEIN